jgi:hypothetical protein
MPVFVCARSRETLKASKKYRITSTAEQTKYVLIAALLVGV